MPSNIDDSSSWDTAAAPVGTDIRNAGSVRSMAQLLANRDRFLYDRTTPLANIAELKAIPLPQNGLTRLVRRSGFYVFDDASNETESLPWVVAPSSGTGRWYHLLYDVLNGAGELPTLGANGKMSAERIPNRLVRAASVQMLGNRTVSGGGGMNIVNDLSIANIDAQPGDLIQIDAFLDLQPGGGAGVTGDADVVLHGASIIEFGARRKWDNVAAANSNVTINSPVYVVSTAALLTARARVSSTSSVTVGGSANPSLMTSFIRVLQFRP